VRFKNYLHRGGAEFAEWNTDITNCHVFSSACILRALYVQNTFIMFYFPSSCPRDDERSEESRGHDRRPTTVRAWVHRDRRGAWSKPASCPFARTADRAPHLARTLAFARKGYRDYCCYILFVL
jgi:hypothetical protein